MLSVVLFSLIVFFDHSFLSFFLGFSWWLWMEVQLLITPCWKNRQKEQRTRTQSARFCGAVAGGIVVVAAIVIAVICAVVLRAGDDSDFFSPNWENIIHVGRWDL